MKLYLSATESCDNLPCYDDGLKKIKYLLMTFYTLRKCNKKTLYRAITHDKDSFLLDSGAFTFMAQNKKGKMSTNIDSYTEDYINFINKYDIKLFFEMDVDLIFGYEKVLELRKRIEEGTGKKTIPVFHNNRGLQGWIEMCKEYDYVAIGTISKLKKHPLVLKQMLRIADEYNTKVHGLGLTDINFLKNLHFYSVDSSTWIRGGKYGVLDTFDGKQIQPISYKDRRAKDYKQINVYNLKNWIKYQEYADTHL